ncbi:hypothetical protein WI75_04835 [Burkholderia ubonensis]|nr:hypothetical protein WI75_04835 [Burkholderia ubonensis]
MIDHCEGETVTEESILSWLGKMAQEPRYARAAASPAAAEVATAWQTGAPPTKADDYDEYIVAVRRKTAPDRVFVFASNYANQYGKEELQDQDGNEYIADGWYTVGHDTSGEFDSLFMPALEDGDEVLGWQSLPKWDDAAPQPAQADAPAQAREPAAWVTDDDRAITDAQKQRALADGGATASSVRPYSIPCYASRAPADAGEARLTDEQLRKALSQAWNLGQTYWQQADSEYASQNRKSDGTRDKYLALVEETCALLNGADL